MDRVYRLEAIEEIRLLKARYFRYMDTKQFELLPAVFTADMKVITPNGDVYADGGPVYAAALAKSLAECVSVHQGFLDEIEILDETRAKGIWAMQDFIEWQDKHPQFGWKSISGRGHYHETYRMEGGTWRIATLTLTRLRLDTA